MASNLDVNQIEKIIHNRYSSNLFLDQKRKISELLIYHDNYLNNNNSKSELNYHNNLVITSKVKSNYSKNNLSSLSKDVKNIELENTKEIKTNNNNLNESKYEFTPYTKSKDLNINLSDLRNWEYSSFDYEIIDSEDFPIINSPFWSFSEIMNSEEEEKGVELRNIILKGNNLFNFQNCGLEINISATLKGESCFWLFTRSDPKIEFDKFTTIIKINKEDKTQKCFFTLGTFVYDVRGNKVLKSFLRHQLINYNKIKDQKYYEDDYCDFKIHVVDNGDDKITAKIHLNDSKIENNIQGDFFLPMFDYSKVMVAGSGQSSVLNNLKIKVFNKLGMQMQGESRNCECCNIF